MIRNQRSKIHRLELVSTARGRPSRKISKVDCPGKSTGRELSPKVKEIEPSDFQHNVRLEILKLAPQEQNLGQPRL